MTIRYRHSMPRTTRCLLPPIDWAWWQAARRNPQPWSPAANVLTPPTYLAGGRGFRGVTTAKTPFAAIAPNIGPHSFAHPSSKGHTWPEQCLGAVREIAGAVGRGDEVAAQ